jgi:hypothetical protein
VAGAYDAPPVEGSDRELNSDRLAVPACRARLVIHSKGEMSEWLKEHAWKSTSVARADAHQIPPTHFPINNFRNTNLLQHVPVTDVLHQGFRGVCDTVLTQNGFAVTPYDSVWSGTRRMVPSSRAISYILN